MKKNLFALVTLSIGLGCLLLLAGCKKTVTEPEEPVIDPEDQEKPSLIIEQKVMDVKMEGGTFSIAYELKNAEDGSMPTAKCENQWISDLKVSKETSQITFTVAPNEETSMRSGDIQVSFPEVETLHITVNQEAGDAASFKIAVEDVTETIVHFSVTPQKKDQKYAVEVLDLIDIEINQWDSDEAIYNQFIEKVKKEAEWSGYAFEELLKEKLLQGTQTALEGKNLGPDKDYVICVFGIDTENGAALSSEVVKSEFRTKSVEMIDANIDIDVTVNGNVVEMTIDPGSYEGAYYFGTITKEDLDKYGAKEMAQSMWGQMLQLGMDLDLGPDLIIETVCNFGIYSQSLTLDPDRDFAIVAFAINEQALICTEPFVEEFHTGSIQASDNQISITITDIQARKATINVSTTNNDPYVAVVIASSEIEHLTTDQEIIDFMCENFYFFPQSGDFSSVVEGLLPETGYTALGFGLNTDIVTTGLTKVEFTTTEAVMGTATGTIQWEKFYDVNAVAAIDPSYEQYIGKDAFLPMTLITDPEDASVYYYSLLSVKAFEENGIEMTAENVSEHLKKQKRKTNTYIASYNAEYIFATMVEDKDGNLGEVWMSEKFSMSAENASDPNEFIESMKSPARVQFLIPAAGSKSENTEPTNRLFQRK